MRANQTAGRGISAQMDVERLRQDYRDLGARSPRADGAEVRPAQGRPCPASRIRPDAPTTGTMLHLHGGG